MSKRTNTEGNSGERLKKIRDT